MMRNWRDARGATYISSTASCHVWKVTPRCGPTATQMHIPRRADASAENRHVRLLSAPCLEVLRARSGSDCVDCVCGCPWNRRLCDDTHGLSRNVIEPNLVEG